MKIYKAASFLVKVNKDSRDKVIEIQVAENLDNAGTPFYLYESREIIVGIYGSLTELNKLTSETEHLFFKNLYEGSININGVFSVFTFEKKSKIFKMWGDPLGVQAIYFSKDLKGIFTASMTLGWLLKETLHNGVFDEIYLLEHLAFGYNIGFDETPYKNIKRIPINHKLSFGKSICYHKNEEISTEKNIFEIDSSKLNKIINSLSKSTIRPMPKLKPFLGLSSGKDCLCLSAFMKKESCDTGTFGVLESPDQLQGKKVAIELGFNHSSINVTSNSEFVKFSKLISYYSGGLGTSTMVDFLKFYLKAVGPENYFIIGEGGENVRTFFYNSDYKSAITTLKNNYLSDQYALKNSLSDNLLSRLNSYPAFYVSQVKNLYSNFDDNKIMLNFYRYKRMGGNFSLRNSILAPFRSKVSPFLNLDFMKLTFNLKMDHYKNDNLHRKIIEQVNPTLLKYFDNPITNGPNYQNFLDRFSKKGLGNEIYKLLNIYLDFATHIFNKKRVLQYCLEQQKNPSRGIYYLMRILSLTNMLYLMNEKTSNKEMMISQIKTFYL